MRERTVFPDGTQFEEMNAHTGTFRVLDIAGNLKGYTHAEHVEYCPTLDEQYRASATTVPRLRVVTP